MIKKYYQSLNSLLYGPFMTPLVFLVFALAFFYQKKGIQELLYAMMVGTAILGVILVMYYTNKFKISRALKSIRNIEEYEKGGVIDRSWILNDRMIACIGLDMHEESTMDIQVMKVEEGVHGKLTIYLTNKEKTFSLSCRDKGEARRFAGYLQKRNPSIKLENIQPEGNGTLQDLGAL